ncbi:uncharacterized protein LOC116247418 [Nymphaea colorata]|uniref:uncharacterized protein LOC116247418 n=1 Tax=Nymphaea colorata TaxID=210225 RepID=UPI00129DA8D5|nr:uncharacterized protein LOC116247418 [Nymphaea colorata]
MAKKVSVPLDEPARARLCGAGDRRRAGYVSSGSEHEADSECLAGLVHGFMEGDDDVGRWDDEEGTEACADLDFSDGEAAVDLEELLRPRGGDPLRAEIAGIVSDAVAGAAGIAGGRPALRRSVMVRLREAGLNAGICKVKWDKAGGLAAGSYEYVDVLVAGDGDHEQQRYVVDVDFAGEFEIARPTRQYDMILAALPRVLVSRPEELRQIVRTVSQAAKKSMKAKGLHLPPWRKNRYMQAKWFGPYRRTTNPVSSASPDDVSSIAAKHRPVLGFDFGKCRPAMPFRPGLAAGAALKAVPF